MNPPPQGVTVVGEMTPEARQVLTPEALKFVAHLSRTFEKRRQELLEERRARARRLDNGERPDFLAATSAVRDGAWTIAPLPEALWCRRVEITGPTDRKMVINALN